MEYKNYLQFDGNKVIAFSTLVAFAENEIPANLMEAGTLTQDETLGKYYNPVDGKFYTNYDFKTGTYSN
ncbi:hypothetical protein PQV03_10110 [Thermoanaerobacterium thermosaccharolyticum]|uniref:hypothetical protein n=1 Tax=Thermoanaerobacterium thermosaccharolyticum TaxID=1517 RepID=UPI003D2DDFC1